MVSRKRRTNSISVLAVLVRWQGDTVIGKDRSTQLHVDRRCEDTSFLIFNYTSPMMMTVGALAPSGFIVIRWVYPKKVFHVALWLSVVLQTQKVWVLISAFLVVNGISGTRAKTNAKTSTNHNGSCNTLVCVELLYLRNSVVMSVHYINSKIENDSVENSSFRGGKKNVESKRSDPWDEIGFQHMLINCHDQTENT